MELKSKTIIPPGGWIYTEPETSLKMTSNTFEGLIDKAVEHRTYKGIFPLNRIMVRAIIQEQICGRISSENPEMVKYA